MASRLLLEGPDLEALLDRVRTEHGSNARIVSADRLRRGGVGGFFSKQWFELGVEVPEPGAQAPAADPVEALLSLADRADSAMIAPAPTFDSALTAAQSHVDGPEQIAAMQRAALTAPPVPAADSPAAVRATDVLGTDLLGPELEATAIASVVADLAASAMAAPPAAPAPPAPARLAPAPAPVPTPASTPRAAAVPESAEVPAAARAKAVARARGAARATAAARLAAADTPAATPPAKAPTTRAKSTTRTTTSPAKATTKAPAKASASSRTASPARAKARSRPKAGSAPRALAKTASVRVSSRVDAPAARAGAGDLLVAMPGRITVVAGALPQAVAVAERVAAQLRLAPSSVLIAGPAEPGRERRIYGPEHAETLAGELRSGGPVVVAVDAPIDVADGAAWAGSIAAALTADAIVAVVDATRKTADIRRHLADLGDVSAVAVHGTTADTDSLDDLGLPVLEA